MNKHFPATNLVTEIESKVGEQFGAEHSSVDITDEELLSTGELSSPETQRSTKVRNCGGYPK